MKHLKDEKAEVMIEGMIVMIITMLMLVWILAIGFLYYQRYTLTIVTNDAAAKIAATYNNPSSDLIMGYIEADELKDRDLYRGFAKSDMLTANETRAGNYIKHVLNKTNFNGVIKNIDVELKLEQDNPFRRHVYVKTDCEFKTPFGEALDFFGMKGTVVYRAEARADCTDVMDYVSTVDYAAYQLGGSGIGANSEIVKAINALVKLYNHVWKDNK